MIESKGWEWEFRKIVYGSDEYKFELELRDRVLRKPIGMSIYNDNLKGEGDDIHMGTFLGGKLVGVLILTRLSDAGVKMRQVAIEEAYRGKGIGSRLVRYAEDFAGSLGYKKVLIHSRKTAVPFYEKLGYVKTGGEFIEVTLPHYKMFKEI